MAQHIIATCAERARLRDPEVKVSGEVLPGDAVSVLLRAGPDAFALVTGVRGWGELAGLCWDRSAWQWRLAPCARSSWSAARSGTFRAPSAVSW